MLSLAAVEYGSGFVLQADTDIEVPVTLEFTAAPTERAPSSAFVNIGE
jgi:hypothetical protein